jgi:UDPglucose 6-dehydrogenase
VVVYDPAAMENARPLLRGRVNFAGSAAECVRKSDVIAITTPWPEFRNLSSEDLKSSSHRPVVVDCWRILSGERFGEAAEFLALGSAPASKFTSDTAVNAAAAADAD